jgi:hypothetical protein
MIEHEDQVESLLRKYRPTGPAPGLRQRVLASARLAGEEARSWLWSPWAWAAAAAGAVLTVGLRTLPLDLIVLLVLSETGKGY